MSKKPKAAHKGAALSVVTINPATNIPLEQLTFSKDNVRQIEPDRQVQALADSIARRSMLQSLSVRPVLDDQGVETGMYEVPGGGRRLRALKLLAKQKRLAHDVPVPCIVKTTGLAVEDSLAENNDREQLHPLDQFRAFAEMIEQGKSIDDTAAAFGVTPAVVRQRLRLAKASPLLLRAYAADDMSLEHLMAFCVTDDHARQEQVWDALHHRPYGAHQIKNMLTENTVAADDKRALFVGIKAYEAAGGTILRDLFDEEESGWLQDVPLLMRLMDEKLEAARAEILTQGWKWAEAAVEFPHSTTMGLSRIPFATTPETQALDEELDRLHDEQDQLAEIDDDELTSKQKKRLAALEGRITEIENTPPAFAPEDVARAGVRISIRRDGAIGYDYGLVRPEDLQQEMADGDDADGLAGGDETQPEEDGRKPLADRLVQDLTSYRTVALRDAMAQNYDVAVIALLHAMCLSHFHYMSSGTCLQVSVRREFPTHADGLADWQATKNVEARHKHFQQILPRHDRHLWDALMQMDQPTLKQLFAHCVSLTVNAVREPHNRRPHAIHHADQVAHALQLDMHEAGWTSTAANLFTRMTKSQILEAVGEAKGPDAVELIEALKKDQMAKEAERLIEGSGWLPLPLRCAEVAEPVGDAGDLEELPAFLTTETEAVAA